MFLEIAAAVWILGSIAYHRLRDKKPARPRAEVEIPQNTEGSVYPIVYGRCRVKTPVVAWSGFPIQTNGINFAPMFFIAGIPFLNGKNTLLQIYSGDVQLAYAKDGVGILLPKYRNISSLTGDGPSSPVLAPGAPWELPGWATNFGLASEQAGAIIGGVVEFLNGNDEQVLVSGGVPVTLTATVMTNAYSHTVPDYMTGNVSVANIPGYRGFLGVFIGGNVFSSTTNIGVSDAPRGAWSWGPSLQAASVQFEVSSYPDGSGLSLTSNKVGEEANPADVIFDLITGPGKLAIPFARVDAVSFIACAKQLLIEGHGYSCSIEEVGTAEDHIVDVLAQIDAVLYEDPDDLKLKIKLVRADYDPLTVPAFTNETCTVSNWSLSGWTSIPNKVRVVFNDRQLRYTENSATAQNMANAVGQDGQVHEFVLRMRGVATLALAQTIASRELSARSRPVAMCSITVSRASSRIMPGDVISLSSDEYGISGMMFRVGAVNRGTIRDGGIKLDLVQDFHYAHRGGLIGPIITGGGRLPPLVHI